MEGQDMLNISSSSDRAGESSGKVNSDSQCLDAIHAGIPDMQGLHLVGLCKPCWRGAKCTIQDICPHCHDKSHAHLIRIRRNKRATRKWRRQREAGNSADQTLREQMLSVDEDDVDTTLDYQPKPSDMSLPDAVMRLPGKITRRWADDSTDEEV